MRPILSALTAASLLGLAGCGDARSAVENVARFIARENQRRHDARFVGADSIIDAAFVGNFAMVRGMLDADADGARAHLQARDPVGMTALHKAVWGGHPAIVSLLIARGADVNARDATGNTPLSLAVRWGRGDLMDPLLAAGADASVRDDQGRTLLHHAAQYNHVEVMKSLLAHGFDVDVQSRVGTPLHGALAMRRLEAATLLLDRGAGLEATDQLGWTPLMVAVSGSPGRPCEMDQVSLLIRRGANVEARAKVGISPLVLAALSNDSAVVATLLARGARPESAKPNGYSALRSAVEMRSPVVARLLLARGADPNQRYSPPHEERLLSRTLGPKDIDVARVLIEFGANVNAVDDRRLTALHKAAREGNVELLHVLMGHGAVVDARDESGWTPLHYAAAQRHLDAARALMERGADPNARTKGGDTPVKLAWGPDGAPLRQLFAGAGATR